MNPCISPLSGKRTLSVVVVPDWWHSGVIVGNGVFCTKGVHVGNGVGGTVGEVAPQATAVDATSMTRLRSRIHFIGFISPRKKQLEFPIITILLDNVDTSPSPGQSSPGQETRFISGSVSINVDLNTLTVHEGTQLMIFDLRFTTDDLQLIDYSIIRQFDNSR